MPFESFPPPPFPPVDAELVDRIVSKLKSQGIFDQFRKDCLADVDIVPAYQNLEKRVNTTVGDFLAKHTWQQDLNKIQLRESLRRHLQLQEFLDLIGNRIVDQAVGPKINSVFRPKVADVVYECLGIDKSKTEPLSTINSSYLSGPPPPVRLVDLLPQDLDPISPESTNMSPGTPTLDERNNNESMHDDSQLSGISELSSHLGNSFTEHPVDSNTIKGISSPKGNASELQFDNFTNLSEKIKQAERSHGQVTDPHTDVKPDVTDSSPFHPLPVDISTSSPKETKLNSSLSDDIKLELMSNNSMSTYDDSKTFPSNKFFKDETCTTFSEGSLASSSLSIKDKVVNSNVKSCLESENSVTPPEPEEKSEAIKEESIPSPKLEEPPLKSDVKCPGESKDLKQPDEKDKKVRDSNSSTKYSRGSEKHRSSDSKHRSSGDKRDDKARKDDSKSSKGSEKDRSSKDEHSRSKEKHKDEKTISKDRSRDKDKSSDKKKGHETSSKVEKKSESKEYSDKDGKLDKERNGKEKSSRDKDRDKDKNSRSKHDRDKDRHDKDKKDRERSDKDRRDRDKNEKDSNNKDKQKSEKDKNEKSRNFKEKSDKNNHEKEKESRHGKDKTKYSDDKKGDKERDKVKESDDKRKEQRRHEKSSHSSSSKKEDKHEDRKSKSNGSSRQESERSKTKEEDEKKDRKRKGERCNDTVKYKEARRSSDRDSNGGKGGMSHRSSGTDVRHVSSQESAHSDKTSTTYNSSGNIDSCEEKLQPSREIHEPSEVDKIITQLNSSLEESQILEGDIDHDEVPVKKPKIANNIFEVRKIMQARKNLDKKNKQEITRNQKEDLEIPNESEKHTSASIGDIPIPEENKENIKTHKVDKLKVAKNGSVVGKFFGFQQSEVEISEKQLLSFCKRTNIWLTGSSIEEGTSSSCTRKELSTTDGECVVDDNLNSLKPRLESLQVEAETTSNDKISCRVSSSNSSCVIEESGVEAKECREVNTSLQETHKTDESNRKTEFRDNRTPERTQPSSFIQQPAFESPVRKTLTCFLNESRTGEDGDTAPLPLTEEMLDSLMKETTLRMEGNSDEEYGNSDSEENREIECLMVFGGRNEKETEEKERPEMEISKRKTPSPVPIASSRVLTRRSSALSPNKTGSQKEGSGEKVSRRNQRLSRCSERYESSDLYKPRPVLPQNWLRVRSRRSALLEDTKSARSDSIANKRGR